MIKITLKDTYLGATTPISPKIRSVHAVKSIMIERLRVWSISQ